MRWRWARINTMEIDDKGRLASSDGFSLFYNLHLRVGGEMLLKEEVVCAIDYNIRLFNKVYVPGQSGL